VKIFRSLIRSKVPIDNSNNAQYIEVKRLIGELEGNLKIIRKELLDGDYPMQEREKIYD
jgi:hypothetical protein